MNKRPLISIIIPYFNRPKKLERCLDSVFSQTYTYYEILVVDDCSTNPLVIDSDYPVTVLRNKKNLGPGLSRNVGLENAKGSFIAFLDSDDYWDPKFLDNCFTRFSENRDVSMVFANGYEINEDEEVTGIRRDRTLILNSILPYILEKHRHWGTGGCLWNSKFLENVQWQATIPWEDYAFDIDVAINCNKIIGIKDCLVYYDTTGKDKISRKDWRQVVSGKNKSVLHISKSLRASHFKLEPNVKQAMTKELINNLITIIGAKSEDKSFIKPIILEIVNWNGFFTGLYLKLILFLPSNTHLRLLRRLKS